ncbi:PilZ domain-containing protein [Paenibacillus athensensis]|uniref:PilZ domain-containing protein n=1 Tax=Paenibacillus athensensis TaxID=1967502 RepID=A0A4Y8Q616_9BACL|nr:PilZ domain-containing protein [Paenibacillus athensensis]MCD1259861.1 PilZ domain-containing protein [Paenibacillus athensensis]
MNWNQAIELELLAPKADCRLIIVGETNDGQPFCYEDKFAIQRIGPAEFTALLEFPGINPLEKLDHVSFIEFSFRERGVLYFTFVDLLQLDVRRTSCLLTLSVPGELTTQQSRQYTRISMLARTPITARIVGLRRKATHAGTVFSGQMLDISGGGLSFITSNRMFYPLYLELSFVLPGQTSKMTVCGEIVRVSNFANDSYRIAVEFCNTPDAILYRIDDYCTSTVNGQG